MWQAGPDYTLAFEGFLLFSRTLTHMASLPFRHEPSPPPERTTGFCVGSSPGLKGAAAGVPKRGACASATVVNLLSTTLRPKVNHLPIEVPLYTKAKLHGYITCWCSGNEGMNPGFGPLKGNHQWLFLGSFHFLFPAPLCHKQGEGHTASIAGNRAVGASTCRPMARSQT